MLAVWKIASRLMRETTCLIPWCMGQSAAEESGKGKVVEETGVVLQHSIYIPSVSQQLSLFYLPAQLLSHYPPPPPPLTCDVQPSWSPSHSGLVSVSSSQTQVLPCPGLNCTAAVTEREEWKVNAAQWEGNGPGPLVDCVFVEQCVSAQGVRAPL